MSGRSTATDNDERKPSFAQPPTRSSSARVCSGPWPESVESRPCFGKAQERARDECPDRHQGLQQAPQAAAGMSSG
jgi:hypothetical protein